MRDQLAARWRDTPTTLIILGLTALVSVVLMLFDQVGTAEIRGGFIPALIGGHVASSPETPVTLPVWLTPLSTTLIHAGFVHLFFNLFVMAICGDALERTLGWRCTAVLYVLGAYAAAGGYWLQSPSSPWPMIGANGAASALLGAYALLFGRRRAPAIGPIPARIVAILWLAAAWIAIQLLVALANLADGVAVTLGSSIAGFLAGLLLARPLLLWYYRKA